MCLSCFVRAYGEVATSGKSPSVLKELLVSSMLNVEAGVAAVTTLPMVTSSVSATPEHEGGAPADSVTGLNLCTIGAPKRFVISSDSSHHSGTNASGAEDDSIVKSAPVPPVMSEAGTKVTSPVYASLFQNSDSMKTVKADAAGHSYSTENCLSERNRLESECGKQADLLKVKDEEIENLKAQLMLKETEAARLRAQVHALETTCSGLRDQVAKLDADILEMDLHLEKKFYPHLLTTIYGWRWPLSYVLKLAVVKCLNSQEYLSALGAAISRAIEKRMQDGLSVGIEHSKAGRSLADIVAYNPAAEADYNFALQRLREVDFSLLAKLKSRKDASVEDIMNLLRLEGPLADAPGMNDLQQNVNQLMLPVHRTEDKVVL
uniref:Transposase (Putative), gypsy type n=1 Tax=Tanacetum cinerariifolium TaxID=118510 RepID=A0A6L2KEJ4_TANCI|nr:hypothetical protein [Tanacetum cinerariifolium]